MNDGAMAGEEHYVFPVSFAQQRLWFLDQLEGSSAVYNIRLPIHLKGQLNVNALQQAFDQLIDRHETLRTTIIEEKGEVQQVIASSAELPLEQIDMRGMSQEQIRKKLGRLGGETFRLHEGPLIRAIVAQVESEEFILLIVIHHIISDGWSSNILYRDLAELYTAACEGREAQLKELGVQYADYAVWQRDWLEGQELDRQVDFWREQLAGAAPLLELPLDYPRPAEQTFNGMRVTAPMAVDLTDRAEALAKQQGSTLFMFMLAAFNIVLGRYAGTEDILVGTPISGRGRTELEDLIGCFVNTVVMRTDLSEQPTVRELLKQVRGRSLEAFSHQDLPFEKLVEELKPPRNMAHAPIFQTMFIMQNQPWENAAMGNLVAGSIEPDKEVNSKFEMTLSMFNLDGVFWSTLEFNTDLFSEATAERFLDHFRIVVEAMIKNPDGKISDISLLNRRDLDVLREINETSAPTAGFKNLPALIEQTAQAAPETPAVEFLDVSLSYGDLMQRSRRLAEALLAAGVEPGDRVGLCLPRSAALPVSVLGVHQAGAAYVPLDPEFPAERLAYMAEDSGMRVLLYGNDEHPLQSWSGPALKLDNGGTLLNADKPDGSPSLPTVSSGDLAYIIYTSGSTGRPKGVRLSQQNLVNFLLGMADKPGMAVGERLLAVTTLSFDISILELFLPLVAGGTTVIAPADVAADGFELSRMLTETRPQMMQATPATWRMLVHAGWQGDQEMRVLCGGEALDPSLARDLLERSCELWNMYGPTETTVWSSCKKITAEDESITVGKPVRETQLHIVDHAGQLAPPGIPGELLIGGLGVAEGYHQRDELTAERFINMESGGVDLGRLYRTGDRARVLPDGETQVMGRVDFQLKLRGFRLEPGEIEAVLEEHDDVSQAVVILREDSPGDQRLVAYLVCNSDSPDMDVLRGHAGERLPDYMVPSAFVGLPELPLTPNGKIDRKNLPAPEWGAVGRSAYVAPRTALEEAIAGMFAEVLGVENVGIQDDFFSLGGHSLLATQLVSRIRDALNLELPLRVLFTRPTVAGLSQALAGASDVVDMPTPEASRERDGLAPLSYTQQRLWFLEKLEPGSAVYNLAWNFRLRGDLRLDLLQTALDVIVARHESLRTSLAEHGGVAWQEANPTLSVSLDIESAPGLSDEAIRERLNQVARKPFDLYEGPLFRMKVLQVGEQDHVLLLVIHHIISDGWSFSILFRELADAYNALLADRLPKFEDLPLQYGDYAVWQRDWLKEGEMERQLDFWRDYLAEAPPVTELPADRARPATQSFQGSRMHELLPAGLTEQLTGLARRESCTLYMVLLAAFDVLVARLSGQDDIVIGTPIAGRRHSELEGLIGFFINTLVIRADLSGNPDFLELLSRVKKACLDAYAHQDVPFEKLVEELKPERSTAHTPIFQIMFNLHNEPHRGVEFDGVDARFVGLDRGTSKFDLTVSVSETSEGLLVGLEYSTDLFDEATISWLIRRYRRLLESVAAQPATDISALEMGVKDEPLRDAQVIPGAGHEAFPRPEVTRTITSRFREIVQRYPDRPAVRDEQQAWTYKELDERSNGIARALKEAGVNPGDRVALLYGQTAAMVPAVIGVLKAGAVYVPLDPYYPAGRLTGVINDAGAQLLVCESAHSDFAGQLCGGDIRVIDGQQLDGCAEAPVTAIEPEDLAYILYTSGTTGKPKGVMQSHENVLHHVSVYSNGLELGHGDRISMLSTYSFDAVVQDLFGTLLNGAELYPFDLRSVDSAEDILNRIVECGITVYHSTPTVYRFLFGGELTCRQDVSAIRVVVLGGEEARRSDYNLFWARFGPETTLVNGLGLTESTMVARSFLKRDTHVWGRSLPVGHPVEETELLLLNDEGQLSGFVGELAVRSRYVTPGYWNQPEETAAVMVADPEIEGGRVFRTGDLAKRLPDGTLVHMGRGDGQVKIRGYRIETGEVESALLDHESVSAAVVVCREKTPREFHLVAYLESSASGTELRSWLREKLPEYMVPTTMMMMDALPRLPNGKVDSQNLPPPEWVQAAETGYVPPRTEIETVLAQIWADLLKVEKVGMHDDFFSLGGHSLLATRLVSRIRDALEVDVPLVSLFEYPSIAGLAPVVEEQAGRQDRPKVPKLRRRRRQSAS